MYGMVNQAVKDLVVSKFGTDAWKTICADIGISTDDFIFMDYYPDKITYDLVVAGSKLLQIPADAILKEFGKHWVLYTAKEGYGPMMDLFGSDFKSCLENLNNLHARMGMSLPHLTPPRFVFCQVSENHYTLEYQSKREGLSPMVMGLLEGLAQKYNVSAKIEFESVDGKKIFKIEVSG